MVGAFFTLQKAYNDGLLTLADLQSIADYHNNGNSPSEGLSADVVNAIKEVADRNMRENELTPVEEAKSDDYLFTKYFGTYNGNIVIMVNDPYHECPAVELDINETIAGVLFHYTNPNKIVVWKKQKG